MKIKKIFLILIILLTLNGCTNVKDLSKEEILNNISVLRKKPNVFKKGYKFYMPKGLRESAAGNNYVVFTSENSNYYLYVDLISYVNKKVLNYDVNSKAFYSKRISYAGKNGYIEINLRENNKYLIEIMYNYAKIEVMVDDKLINEALINSINILSSITYDDAIINVLLNDDNLDYTEEIFDMFKDAEDSSNILDFVIEDNPVDDKSDVKDTDYIN